MTFWQTFIFAIVQGVTELFPISSVAHGVITPYVFHWSLDPGFMKQNFLPYVVMLHLGTAIALFLFFWREWFAMIRSLLDFRQKSSRRLLTLVVVGTIPAGILGFVLERPIRHMFSDVTSAAVFLIVNGIMLFWGERLRGRGQKEINDMTYRQATVVGLFQAMALIPGFSRSGASMTAGFWLGLKHEESARYSMLLSTPIIAGASVLEVPKLFKSGVHNLLPMSLLGGTLAGLFAFVSVYILMHWFKKHEVDAMRPFAYYCWALGIIVLVTRFI